MAEIQVTNLTFEYEGSFEPVFEAVSYTHLTLPTKLEV